jgi:hypothetical protein
VHSRRPGQTETRRHVSCDGSFHRNRKNGYGAATPPQTYAGACGIELRDGDIYRECSAAFGATIEEREAS